MPNGGLLPSCFICKHSRKTDAIGAVACQQHGMTVQHAMHMICPDIDHPNLKQFRKKHPLVDGQFYIWIEIHYRTAEHPTLPQYYHELVLLAPLATYLAWSEDERQEAELALRRQKQAEFEQKYGKHDT